MIRTKGATIAFCGLLAALTAGSAPAQAAPPKPPKPPVASAERGAVLFASTGCYQCHGRAAQGAMGVGPPLRPLRRQLGGFAAYVRQPAGQMPPYSPALLSQADVEDLYAYLRGLPITPHADQIPLLAPYLAPCGGATSKARTCRPSGGSK